MTRARGKIDITRAGLEPRRVTSHRVVGREPSLYTLPACRVYWLLNQQKGFG